MNFRKGVIVLRGHPKTGLKNRRPGEVRNVPMIPQMRALLKGIRAERSDEEKEASVMQVSECQKAMDRAAARIGMKRLTHHDLRHLFATRCIENGVDFRTLAEWMWHRDGGALIMQRYGHVRTQHSAAMAQKVEF